MNEEKISQEFRLRKIVETRNYFLEEIKHNRLLGKKHKNVSKVSNWYSYWYCQFCYMTKNLYKESNQSIFQI